MKDIYRAVLERKKLFPHHQEELHTKRGFTDETIARNKFFSGGEYLTGIEQYLIENFEESDLLESGVCIKPDGRHIAISPMLLEDRIIIPYLDKDGQPYLLRPHKLGLKHVEVQIYHELNLAREVVLTEGEFKAAACQQLGIPAIAVPGIGSFSHKHYPRMVSVLNSFNVKDICIIFDNEVKDDPNFKSYKEEPSKRFDVQYYAHYMAEALRKEGFRTQIGTIPDGWRVDGKADLDGALAQGKTKEDFLLIIKQSKTDKEFFADLSKEAQGIIKRKRQKRFLRSNIHVNWGKYYATRIFGQGKNKVEDEVEISNFVIKIIATHQTPENIIREVVFINEFGERTKSFQLNPEEMSSADAFRTFCLSKGNFLWKGRKEELDMIWQEQFLEDDGRHIIEHDHIGWIEDDKCWLFGNVLINGTKELRPDKNHVFWLEKKGVKPSPIEIYGKKSQSMSVPYLSLESFDSNVLRDKLALAMGWEESGVCLGWAYSVLFMEDVFDLQGFFPYLWLTGKTSSGKSHIGDWIMHIFGNESGGIQARDTTPVGLQRYMSYYSSLPVFMDEYRNEDKVTNKNGLLRNAYNRQSAIKGIKSDFGIRQASVRGALLVTGQESPRDNAILNRSINVVVTAKRRDPKNNPFDWFQLNKVKFSNIAYEILKNKPNTIERYKELFYDARDYYNKQLGIDSRKSSNYAVINAGYGLIYGVNEKFYEFMESEIKRVSYEIDREEESLVFWDDVLALKHRGALNKKYWLCEELSGHKIVYVYFDGLYNIWSEDYSRRNRREPFTPASLRNIIKNEDYFAEDIKDSDGKLPRKVINDIQHRCMPLWFNKCPDSLKSIIDSEGGYGATGGYEGGYDKQLQYSSL